MWFPPTYDRDWIQLLMTGNMLFEIIDPFLMWKQIYTSLRETITTSRSVEVSRPSYIFHHPV